jgi:hypothetical protein
MNYFSLGESRRDERLLLAHRFRLPFGCLTGVESSLGFRFGRCAFGKRHVVRFKGRKQQLDGVFVAISCAPPFAKMQRSSTCPHLLQGCLPISL